VVICLERGSDLYMAQQMPVPLTVSSFSKIQIDFTFWYRLTWVVPEKGPLNGCVCACVRVCSVYKNAVLKVPCDYSEHPCNSARNSDVWLSMSL